MVRKEKKKSVFSSQKDNQYEGRTRRNCQNSITSVRCTSDWDPYKINLDLELQTKNCFLKEVQGDGNCLFRAISDQLIGSEHLYIELRSKTCEYIKNHKETLKFYLDDPENDDIDEYVEEMREEGAWAGYIEVYAMSQILELNFVVVSYQVENGNRKIETSYYKHFDDSAVRCLFLFFHNGENIPEHYDSIRSNIDLHGENKYSNPSHNCENNEKTVLNTRIDPSLFLSNNRKGSTELSDMGELEAKFQYYNIEDDDHFSIPNSPGYSPVKKDILKNKKEKKKLSKKERKRFSKECGVSSEKRNCAKKLKTYSDNMEVTSVVSDFGSINNDLNRLEMLESERSVNAEFNRKCLQLDKELYDKIVQITT